MSAPQTQSFIEEEVNLSPIRDEDEVFLIRVPKGFDINKLNGVEYSPPGNVQIEVKEGKRGIISVMELSSHAGQNIDVNLLVKSDDNEIVAGPCINKTLCVTKSVHLNPTVSDNTMFKLRSSEPVAYPTGLMPRFTPFGAGQPLKTKRKKKKKSKRRLSEDISNDFTIEHGSKRKRIKLENSAESALLFSQDRHSSDADTSLSQSVFKSSKSKKKHHKESDNMNISQSGNISSMNGLNCGEGTLVFNNYVEKYKTKDRRSSVFTGSDAKSVPIDSSDDVFEGTMNSSSSGSHRKKKKRKLSSGYQSINTSVDESFVSPGLLNSAEKSLKKKKKRERIVTVVE